MVSLTADRAGRTVTGTVQNWDSSEEYDVEMHPRPHCSSGYSRRSSPCRRSDISEHEPPRAEHRECARPLPDVAEPVSRDRSGSVLDLRRVGSKPYCPDKLGCCKYRHGRRDF